MPKSHWGLEQVRAGQIPILPPGGGGPSGGDRPLSGTWSLAGHEAPVARMERHSISTAKLYNPKVEAFEAFEDRFLDAIKHFGWEGSDKVYYLKEYLNIEASNFLWSCGMGKTADEY